ncbi:MAG: hypothetical protein GY953_13790 [bacterium]|nr:hypothetical protein [bacterium]
MSALEDRGRCRRAYVVAGLGGSQFALPQAVDMVRSDDDRDLASGAMVMAASDPANPYGAALAWPRSNTAARPGRKAGASVVLISGRLTAYVERGGASVLIFVDDEETQKKTATALAEAVGEGLLPPLNIKRINSGDLQNPFVEHLVEAGAERTPNSLRFRRH